MSTLVSKLARSFLFTKIIAMVAAHANFLLPGQRLADTPHWFAIRHPHPAYPVHILILPRRAITDWLSFPANEPEMYVEFVELSQRLIRDERLEGIGYRLIVNGGEYQSIPQFHVHLVSGNPEDAKKSV